MNASDRLLGPGGLVYDPDTRTVTVSETTADLTGHEATLLRVLLEERGRVIPYEELARRAWGYESTGDQRFIYTAAWRLRRTLAAIGAPNVVEGVRGVGYSIPQEETYLSPGLRVFAVFDPMDPEWLLSMVSDSGAELTGHSTTALTTQPGVAMGLWHPDKREHLDEVTEQALTIGPATATGQRLIRADGGKVEVDVAVSRLDRRDATPHALAIVTLSSS